MLRAWPPLACRGRVFRWGRRTYVMGILNVTPDSFFDGGRYADPSAAAARARQLVAEGADLIDIGAESTRPGAEPVPEDEELRRLLPALRAVRAAVDVPISVDTRKARVAAAALAEGADLLNDVSGLRDDPDLAAVAARAGVPVIVMHRRPHGFTAYDDLWADVRAGLEESIAIAVRAGIPRERIVVDPGFGFGKSPEQNLELVRGLHRLHDLGPVLLGVSRKSTIGHLLGGLPPEERLEGTLALIALAVAAGADLVRVHDVAAAVRTVRVADAVARAGEAPHPERASEPAVPAEPPREAVIRLSGLRFWAHHGVLEHERAHGQPFRVDVSAAYRRDAADDDLAAAVDYSALYRLVAEEVTRAPRLLVETVAEAVAERVLAADPRILWVDVTVHKPHAPVGGPVDDVAVRVHRARPASTAWLRPVGSP